MTTPPTPRLLPSTRPDGKPGYLLTDRDDSYVARYADGVEALQLGMCGGLMEHARAMIGDPAVDARQLRFLAQQLCAALADAVRIAQLRGAG
ncbi:hypothetical protein [Streptomyces sp. NPDC059008]|uniref:hypothetical protein n=1 Tax=Streptomyces sp. NPDC059008 TaxID=3346693 RepID=UPI003685CB09